MDVLHHRQWDGGKGGGLPEDIPPFPSRRGASTHQGLRYRLGDLQADCRASSWPHLGDFTARRRLDFHVHGSQMTWVQPHLFEITFAAIQESSIPPLRYHI